MERDTNDDPPTIARIAAAATASDLALLVMSPTGTAMVTLSANAALVLGRSQECDVRIDDAKLSRKHAVVHAGAHIEIEDLASLNGTFVRGERLAANVRVALGVGESVTLGNTVLVIQPAAHSARPRHIWSHGYFEARLEEECGRAGRGEAPFAILRLRIEVPEGAAIDPETQDAGPITALAMWLRESDIIAKYAPREYELLLLGAGAEEADARAADLARQLDGASLKAAIGVAAYPRDGRTPEALVERTSRIIAPRADAEGDVANEGTLLSSGALARMEKLIGRVAAGVINVLILGETGVGKEVLARRVHAESKRAASPLVSLNCAALAESLLESELFGHEKGAFTGAIHAKPGLLESANGGTVFLDEVGEMPPATQAKLLRVLEQREVTRVGALRPRAIDVRFIAATNRNLEHEVAEGRFRADLFFRLNGISLTLPPLRERVDEIEPLARMFVDSACRAMARPATMRIARDAMDVLKSYQWPGNIRELRNVIDRAVLLCSGDVIGKEHLPLEKMGPVFAVRAPPARAFSSPRGPTLPPAAGSDATLPGLRAVDWESATQSLRGADLGAKDLERQRIEDALEKCAGNQSHAAKMLGISRATLIRRIEEFGLTRPRKRD